MTDHKLVADVLSVIGNNLDRWDQGEYVSACGSRMCFAGWALVLRGYRHHDNGMDNSFISPSGEILEFASKVEAEAANILGFDDDTMYQVFHWQPEDELPTDCEDNVIADKNGQFEAFRTHVLAVTRGENQA